MEKLLEYLNNLSRENRTIFCDKCDTSEGYLRKAISINQSLNASLCVAIEKNSNGDVARKDLHKDDWWQIWPELINKRAVAA